MINQILVKYRYDLKPISDMKSIYDIDIDDFKNGTMQFHQHEVSMFVDDDGKTKILYNRFGATGIISKNI